MYIRIYGTSPDMEYMYYIDMQKQKWYPNKSYLQQTDDETVAATAAHIVVNIVVSPYAWTSGRCIEHDNILNAPLANSHGPATAPRFHNLYPVIMVLRRAKNKWKKWDELYHQHASTWQQKIWTYKSCSIAAGTTSLTTFPQV